MSADDSQLLVAYDGRVRVAREFSVQPLVPAKATGKPVVLYSYDRGARVTYYIGAVAKNRDDDNGDGLCPSLYIDLWQLILALLSVWNERAQLANEIPLTFKEVWLRFAGKSDRQSRPSQAQRERLNRLWDDLDALRMKIVAPGEPDRIVDVVHYETARRTFHASERRETCIAKFSFDVRFLSAVRYSALSQDIRLDVLSSITSDYVRAAYLWLPSKAFKRPLRSAQIPDREVPLSPALRSEVAAISSRELLGALGCEPMARHARKRMLLQNGDRSLLWQLHGLELMRRGMHLGVTSWDADDDFYVGVYAFTSPDWQPGKTRRKRPEPRDDSRLMENFLAGGGSREAFQHWVYHQGPLPKVDDYQLERLQQYGVENLAGSMPFFRMALALIGPDEFRTVVGFLSEASVIKKSPGSLFRSMLLNRVKELAAKRTETFRRHAPAGQTEMPLP